MESKFKAREFVRDFRECEDKYERLYHIGDNLDRMVYTLLERPTQDNSEIQSILRTFLWRKRVCKTICRVVSSGEFEINAGLIVILGDLLVRANSEEIDENPDMQKVYMTYKELINEMLATRAKKVSRKAEIPMSTALNLLVEMPEPLVEDMKLSLILTYINRLLRKLILVAKDPDNGITEDNIDVIIENVIGPYQTLRFVIQVLLEKADMVQNLDSNQIKMWNLLTTFALEYLSTGSRKDIASVLYTQYIKKRMADEKMGRDSDRRVSLFDLSAEKYPKIKGAIEDFLEERDDWERIKKYLQ